MGGGVNAGTPVQYLYWRQVLRAGIAFVASPNPDLCGDDLARDGPVPGELQPVTGIADWIPWESVGLAKVEKPAGLEVFRDISGTPRAPLGYLYAVAHTCPGGTPACGLVTSASAFLSPIDVWADGPERYPMRVHGEQLTVTLVGYGGTPTDPSVQVRRIDRVNLDRANQILPNGMALAQARNEARKLRELEARAGVAGRFADPRRMSKTIEVYLLQAERSR